MNPNKLQKLRHQAFVQQNSRCFYCTLPIWEGDPTEFLARHGISPRKAKYLRCTAEHLVAQQDGGVDTPHNIAAACVWCNRMRHWKRQDKAPSPEQYKKRVSQLICKRRWHPAFDIYQGDSKWQRAVPCVEVLDRTLEHAENPVLVPED